MLNAKATRTTKKKKNEHSLNKQTNKKKKL